MARHEVRKKVNEQSRNKAEDHRNLWSEDQVAYLLEFWDSATLEEIAEVVGRTVEACRQKYYMIQWGESQEPVKAELKKVNEWTTGFTSLEAMGY